MDLRLYLNDQLADLPTNAAQALRLAKLGTDASDLEQRAADVSYTLTLPPTRGNDRIFERRRVPAVLGKFHPPAPYVARLYADGRLLLRGTWQPSQLAPRGGYTGKLVSDEVDVFAAIGTKTLQELRLPPFVYRGQHGFEARLALSMADTLLQFPLVAYGNFFHDPSGTGDGTVPPGNQIGRGLEIDEYLPSASFVLVLRQIFADVGWQVKGAPLDDPDIREACLPFVGQEYPFNWGELLKLEARHDAPFTYSFETLLQSENVAPYRHYQVLMPTVVYSPARRYRPAAVGPAGELRTVYTVRKPGGYHLRLELALSSWRDGGGGAHTLQLLAAEAGQQLHEARVLLSVPLPAGGGGGALVLDTATLSANGVYLGETDRVVPCLVTSDTGVSALVADLASLVFTVTPVVADVGPLAIDVAAGLPAMTQRDLVKAFVTLSNLRFTTDALSKTLTFYYREQYEEPPALAVDLSDRADPEACTFVPALPARRVLLAWAEDTSDALLTAGQADTAFEAGGTEQEQKLQLPFAPTALRTYVTPGGALVTLPTLASTQQLQTPLNEVNWSFGYAPRLLRYRGRSTERVPLAFQESPETRYGVADFGGLAFSGPGGRFARFYRGYLEGLRHGHVAKGLFALDAATFAQLSGATAVRLWGTLYRLGAIPSFTVGGRQLTECEWLCVAPVAIGGGQLPATASPDRQYEWHPAEFNTAEFY